MNSIKLHNMHNPASRQKGVVLIVGLVLLVALTILGVNALSTTSLEQRMAGNMGDINLAFNASETASRAAQYIVMNRATFLEQRATCTSTTGDPSSDICVQDFDYTNWWESKDNTWWQANGVMLAGSLSDIKTQPRIIIEQTPDPGLSVGGVNYLQGGDTQIFRITTRGTGISDNSEAIVQQTIIKRYR